MAEKPWASILKILARGDEEALRRHMAADITDEEKLELAIFLRKRLHEAAPEIFGGAKERGET